MPTLCRQAEETIAQPNLLMWAQRAQLTPITRTLIYLNAYLCVYVFIYERCLHMNEQPRMGGCMPTGCMYTRLLHIQDHSCGLSAATLSRATLQIAQLTPITRTLIYINAYSWKPSVEDMLLDLHSDDTTPSRIMSDYVMSLAMMCRRLVACYRTLVTYVLCVPTNQHYLIPWIKDPSSRILHPGLDP